MLQRSGLFMGALCARVGVVVGQWAASLAIGADWALLPIFSGAASFLSGWFCWQRLVARAVAFAPGRAAGALSYLLLPFPLGQFRVLDLQSSLRAATCRHLERLVGCRCARVLESALPRLAHAAGGQPPGRRAAHLAAPQALVLAGGKQILVTVWCSTPFCLRRPGSAGAAFVDRMRRIDKT